MLTSSWPVANPCLIPRITGSVSWGGWQGEDEQCWYGWSGRERCIINSTEAQEELMVYRHKANTHPLVANHMKEHTQTGNKKVLDSFHASFILHALTLVAKGSKGIVEIENQITEHGTKPTVRWHCASQSKQRLAGVLSLSHYVSLSIFVTAKHFGIVSVHRADSIRAQRWAGLASSWCVYYTSNQRTSAGGHLASTSPTQKAAAGLRQAAQPWQKHETYCCFTLV